MPDQIKTDCLIVGAGPVGLFAVFELGILGINAEVIDNLDKIGGQCAELYPDKPIYDIPGLPECTGQSLIDNLLKQIKPFKTNFHLNQRVDSIKKIDDQWLAVTSSGNEILTPNIFIAGGVGSFEPRKPPIDGINKFENKGLSYSVINKDYYKDKKIVIFGGGDSALDWTVELAKIAKKIILVHRRDEFKAFEHTVNQMRELVKSGKVELLTKYQINNILGDDNVSSVEIKNNDGNLETRECDEVLIFHGLKMELGPINDWGLNLDEKQISVNTEDFETNLPGIFAIGDISNYPGKLKLILSGFHEAALAAQTAFKRARPDENLVFRYTTSSKDIQEKLGVK
ncbi:MAG: NAD(P)/FAD-dependent oxidoreductase [Pelagibacterales bacterium]|nr:NAD(P)/FAD-dependent oxidoreductase [Pelagibacterales bacterium]